MSEELRAVCLACGVINRLPSGRLAADAKCGSCGKPLFTGRPVDVDAAMLMRQVEKGTIPVVVDVWASWCGPCRVMAPEYERATAAMEPGARFVKLDSDAEQAISAKLAIRSIPTLLLFTGGKEIARMSGAMSAAKIGSWVADRLNQSG